MKKSRVRSTRSYFLTAGVLIIVGTILVTFTYFEQVTWYALHPPHSGWFTTFDQSFHGELSASNTSIDIPLEVDYGLELLELRELYTNNTLITIIIRNANNELIFQLVNLTAPQDNGPHSVEIIGGLANEYYHTATVSVTRVTSAVHFRLRIILKNFVAVSLVPPPYYRFISGYIIGIVLIVLGFILLELILRRYHLGYH